MPWGEGDSELQSNAKTCLLPSEPQRTHLAEGQDKLLGGHVTPVHPGSSATEGLTNECPTTCSAESALSCREGFAPARGQPPEAGPQRLKVCLRIRERVFEPRVGCSSSRHVVNSGSRGEDAQKGSRSRKSTPLGHAWHACRGTSKAGNSPGRRQSQSPRNFAAGLRPVLCVNGCAN